LNHGKRVAGLFFTFELRIRKLDAADLLLLKRIKALFKEKLDDCKGNDPFGRYEFFKMCFVSNEILITWRPENTLSQ
jgi:hypothetical protein